MVVEKVKKYDCISRLIELEKEKYPKEAFIKKLAEVFSRPKEKQLHYINPYFCSENASFRGVVRDLYLQIITIDGFVDSILIDCTHVAKREHINDFIHFKWNAERVVNEVRKNWGK